MERLNDSSTTTSSTAIHSFNVQVRQPDRQLPTANPIKVQERRIPITVAGQFTRRLFGVLFILHLTIVVVLIIFLTIHGLVSTHAHHFHPRKWYPPLLTSTACGGVVAFGIATRKPSTTIKAVFWLSPLLTCAVGIVLVLVSSSGSLAIGIVAVILAVIQSLYACWVNPRFHYAMEVLSRSTEFPPDKTALMVTLSIIIGVLYSGFVVAGIGGATATGGGVINVSFIVVILISLAWIMQVIKNTLHVTIARIKYIQLVSGMDMNTMVAFRDTIKHSMGNVCIGSAIVPVLTVVRGTARVISLIVGDTDEFLFSCANCYLSVASTLFQSGNRWGFVRVGVDNKGFTQASFETWAMFKAAGLEPLIDSDLTGAFCFLSGIVGGSICTLVAGIWALVIHKSYATEVSIYAFIIGYFLCRVAMSWPQACISAYYVAYAENPQNIRFDSTIPVRIQDLQRYQA